MKGGLLFDFGQISPEESLDYNYNLSFKSQNLNPIEQIIHTINFSECLGSG